MNKISLQNFPKIEFQGHPLCWRVQVRLVVDEGGEDALLSQEPPSPILPTTTPTQPNPTLKIWQVHL